MNTPTRFTLTRPLLASMIAIVLVAGFVIMAIPSLTTAVFIGAGGESDPDAKLSRLIARHDDAKQTYVDRFNGRSLFFKPKMPEPPRPPKVVEEKPEERPVVVQRPVEPPGPKDAPSEYGGPAPIGIVGGYVWFAANGDDEMMVAVGDEIAGQDAKVIEIISGNLVKMQWTKRGHKPGEYEVAIFDSPTFASSEPKAAGDGPHDLNLVGTPGRASSSSSSSSRARTAADKAREQRAAARNRGRNSRNNDRGNPPS